MSTPAAFVADDGSVQQDVICAKLPELYKAAEKAREEAEERLTLKRREYDIEVKVHAATKPERDSYIKGYEAAESRAARLLTAIKEIESKAGHFGEAPPPPEWMPMLSLIAWVGRTARAALAAEEEK